MYRFLSIPFIILIILCSKVRAYSPQKINIYYDLNMVCISSNNKCWSFAKGSSSYSTPTWEGGRPLIIHHKNGFTWRNPLTGKVYGIGKHNLGNIWIQFYEDDNPLSSRYKWVYGLNSNRPYT